jgi:hypothetical protein
VIFGSKCYFDPVPLTRLSLTDFRSYREALIAPGPGLVVLTGENGAGKTNVLERYRCFRRARASYREPFRNGGNGGLGGFAVAAELGFPTRGERLRSAQARPQRRPNGGRYVSTGLPRPHVARRVAVRPVAYAGNGPAVSRRERAAAAASSIGWCWHCPPPMPSTPRATKRRCGRATSCLPKKVPDRDWLRRWRRGWPSMARP